MKGRGLFTVDYEDGKQKTYTDSLCNSRCDISGRQKLKDAEKQA
jgi:hypothetical protein